MNMSVLPGRVLSHSARHCRSSVKAQVASYRPLPVAAKPKLTHNHTSAFSISESNGGLPEERQAAIAETLQRCMEMLAERTDKFVGYPINLDYDYSALNGLFSYSINNVGDPFIQATYGMHTREFEVGVLDWFARLWDIDQNEYWGYVTNGGTEGNLHGILVGRENLPDGILYASKETHYSVFKAARMYRMDTIKVQTLPNGEVDYQDFAAQLRANTSRPAIVNVNIGTTMKGAVDDLDRILDILQATGYSEDRFYIHCDGALLGVMMPFIQAAPTMTFKKPIGSVSVSGHKFVGTPMPCGVVIARKRYVKALSNDEVEYINNKDATITGSRNGHAPVFLWYALQCKGYEGMRRDVEYCMRTALYLKHMLDSAGIQTMLNDVSNTVVFERPLDDALVRKWQLACEGDIAHVVVMPHVTIDQLDEFVADYINSRARLACAAAGPLLGWAVNRE